MTGRTRARTKPRKPKPNSTNPPESEANVTVSILSFDLDDTVWDPRPALIAADTAQWKFLATQFPALADHFTKDRVMGCRKRVIDSSPLIVGDVTALRIEVMQQLLLSLGVGADMALEAANDAFAAFMAQRNDVILFPDAREVLSQLATQFTLIAITNGNADVHKTPLGPFFRLAFRADEVGSAKPEAKIFEVAMRSLDCLPSEVIHIGDSIETDVNGALNAGITPVWFNPEGKENGLGVNEVRSLTELPAVIARLNV
jgi:putative hydrolase of the HAD superfamily